MKFFDELDEYVVLKLPLDDFKGATKTLERNFEMAGYEVREKIRKDERKLLKSFFHNWALPYYGTLNGWREDSPIYALHNGTLIGGLYVCNKMEFDESNHWGQLHYFYTGYSYQRRGIHSVLFKEAINKARSWDLRGVIINTDRYLLPELYIKWGATPWKRIMKKERTGRGIFFLKKFRPFLKKYLR